MYEVLDAHPLTVVIVVGTMMVTPVYVLATHVASGASTRTGLRTGIAFVVFGAVMSWVCLSGLPGRLGPAGNLIILVAWILPSLLLYLGRHRLLDRRLSQRWLIGLQIFRAIGGVFLIEMTRGNIPGVFAYPAGIGDIVVALIALGVLIRYAGADRIPGSAVFAVITVGIVDFISAFFFGFGSSETPLQLFFPEVPNRTIVFPTGMIPLFLVPYAIFFHTLSALSYARFERGAK